MEGIIFDKQRFALHDGPGIRTVVFMKGCPLSCRWCCNPESIIMNPQLSYSKSKCKEFENCLSACSENVFSYKFWKPKVDHKKCIGCNKCVDVCPSEALKMYGYSASVDNILDDVLKDKEYYENTGGGLTLSGGEPLMQFDFAFESLLKAKKAGLHTCIETAGFVEKSKMELVQSVTDLFLYDYKITNDNAHQYYTGVSNGKIIENLKMILEMGSKVILRCVIIPGVNDTSDHFKAIANLSQHKNILEVEIMPYHEYGKHKYEQIGMEAFEFSVKTVDKELALLWVEEIKQHGCQKIKLG